MRRFLSAILFTCAASFSLSCCKSDEAKSSKGQSGQGITLQLNFKPGESYEYRSENNMVIVERAMGQELKTTNDMEIALRFDIIGREAAGIEMAVTYQKLVLRLQNMMLHAEYDSGDSATGDTGMFGNMKGLIGKSFNVLIKPNGQVVHFSGLDSLLNNIDTDNEDPISKATAGYVQKALSDTAMRAMVTESFHFYPAKPVRIGDTWTNVNRSASSIGDLVLNNTYRLVTVKNGIADIEVHATMRSDSTSSTHAIEGLQGVKIDLNGTVDGMLMVEVATGMLRDGTMKQELSGDISIGGMRVPVTMSTDMKMSGKRLK